MKIFNYIVVLDDGREIENTNHNYVDYEGSTFGHVKLQARNIAIEGVFVKNSKGGGIFYGPHRIGCVKIVIEEVEHVEPKKRKWFS